MWAIGLYLWPSTRRRIHPLLRLINRQPPRSHRHQPYILGFRHITSPLSENITGVLASENSIYYFSGGEGRRHGDLLGLERAPVCSWPPLTFRTARIWPAAETKSNASSGTPWHSEPKTCAGFRNVSESSKYTNYHKAIVTDSWPWGRLDAEHITFTIWT